MANKQITVKTKQQIKQVNDANNHAMVVTEDGELMADAILVATGRRANTQGLDLDKAGVILTDKGNIAVNDRLQTSVPHIYAMGDVAGSPQFTYISLDDYRVVKSQVLGDGTYTTKDALLPMRCLPIHRLPMLA